MLAKFNELHWLARFLVMMVIAVGIWYAFDYFLMSSTRAETAELRNHLEELRSNNAQASIVESRLPEFKARFEQLKAEYEQTKELLPETVELSKVLDSLQATAKNNNLLVVVFSPDEKTDVQKEFYRMKPVSVKLIGNYTNLQNFFRQIAELKRIVNIANLEIVALPEQREGQTLTASFTLSALYAEKEDVNNLKPLPAPGQSPAPGQPPAADAAQASTPSAPPAKAPMN